MSEQAALKKGLPRYSRRPFPAYRHVPGETPHPRRDARGHSHGLPEPDAASLPPQDWRRDEAYLFAVDLYNHGYWWECHEIFEALWRAAGPRAGGPARRAGRQDPADASFFQGLLQVAAANLKRLTGRHEGAVSLADKGLARLDRFHAVHRGLDVSAFVREARACFAGDRDTPPAIRLSLPSG